MFCTTFELLGLQLTLCKNIFKESFEDTLEKVISVQRYCLSLAITSVSGPKIKQRHVAIDASNTTEKYKFTISRNCFNIKRYLIEFTSHNVFLYFHILIQGTWYPNISYRYNAPFETS